MGWVGDPLAPPARLDPPGWTGAPSGLVVPAPSPGWLGGIRAASALGLGLPEGQLEALLEAAAFGDGDAIGYLVAKVQGEAFGAGVPAGVAAYVTEGLAAGQGLPSGLAIVHYQVAGDATGTGTPAGAARFPTMAETTVSTPNASGAYSLPIPYWSHALDPVALGAGGGGQASAAFFNYGQPGDPGQFAPYTVIRGVDIPWSLGALTGTVGNAGAGGPGPSAVPGGAGGDTTVVIPNLGTLTGPGGAGGVGWAGSQTATRGKSPGTHVYNGKSYVGGAAVTSNSQPGNPPGGSGSGSAQFSSGYNGAHGRAWLRAYQTS